MSTVNTGETTADGTDVSAPEADERALSKDDTFHILQNERRRRVLQYLSETEGAVDMRDIAEQVAAWEHDTTVQALTSDQRQRVYIALYQSHLPKLADFGLITYNRSRGIVERTPLADEVTAYLDGGSDASADGAEVEDDPDWVTCYGATTAASIVLIAAVWAVPALATISGLGLAVLITAMYAVVTVGLIALTRDDRRSH